jgi:hypothetical protein
MTYTEKYFLMKEWISDNILDVHDLMDFLEISIEDVLKVFPDKVVESYGKVYTEEESEDGELGEDGEEEAQGDFDKDFE